MQFCLLETDDGGVRVTHHVADDITTSGGVETADVPKNNLKITIHKEERGPWVAEEWS